MKPLSPKPAPLYAVPALDKGLDILEALANSPSPLSLAELARDLRRGSTELFRMLVCLERRAYVRRDAVSGKFTPTLRLFELAHAHAPLKTLLEAAREPIRDIAETLSESCHLSVLERGKLLVIAHEDSPKHVRLSFKVGSTFPPRRTASGRLLLNPQLKFVTARDETIVGVDDAAVRIGHPGAEVHAALAVSWLRSHKGAKKPPAVLRVLQAKAKEINSKLGLLGK